MRDRKASSRGEGLVKVGMALGYFQLVILALALLALIAVFGFGVFIALLQ